VHLEGEPIGAVEDFYEQREAGAGLRHYPTAYERLAVLLGKLRQRAAFVRAGSHLVLLVNKPGFSDGFVGVGLEVLASPDAMVVLRYEAQGTQGWFV
jgi:hypothetical protein